MKRTIKLISVVLAVLALASCAKEELTVLHPDQFKAGQLAEISGEYILSMDNADETMATFTFDKTDYGLSAAVQYALYADINSDFSKEKKLGSASSAENGISVSVKNVNNLLIGYGCPAGQSVTVYFRLKSNMMGEKNIIDGTEIISNTVSSSITPYVAVKEYAKVWALGSFNSWSHDTAQYLYNYAEDDVIYKGVIDFGEDHAENQFKFTGAASWDNDTGNWGVADASTPAESDEVQLLNASNDNITQYTAKRYYMFSLNKSTLVLSKLASFDQIGIVGTVYSWDEDVVMEYNAFKGRFWVDMSIPAGSEIKFRADAGWDLNWGSSDGSTIAKNGDNIVVADAGDYRVYLNIGEGTFSLDASMYGKDEPTESDETPEPEPEPAYQGWGITGSIASANINWDGDIEMTEEDGVWTGYATLTTSDSFKLRKDAAWEENYGGPGDDEPYTITVGTAFAATAGGKNMAVPADGFYKIVLNTNDETVCVSSGTVWGVIGDFNSWSGDVFMTEADGVWTSPEIALEAGTGFKIRQNSGWDVNRGATGDVEPYAVTLGEAFDVVNNGKNLTVGASGNYILTYDPVAEKITVNNAKKVWGLIGDFNSWGGDVAMTEVVPGIWVSPKTDISSGKWKVRFDGGWDTNYGGNTPTKVGQFVQAVAGGSDILFNGEFSVVLNLNNGTVGTLGWGVTGEIASCPNIAWNNDIPMNLTTDGTWMSCPIALTTDDAIKIRFGGGWDQNFGGSCAAIDTPFAAADGGDNIKVPTDGTYVIIYDPDQGQICVSTSFCGLIGDFNSWSGDDFMFYAGEGKWYSFNRHYESGWKIRMGAGWDMNRGATGDVEPFAVPFGEAFDVVNNGKNLTVADQGVPAAGFNIVYDEKAETITVSQEVML